MTSLRSSGSFLALLLFPEEAVLRLFSSLAEEREAGFLAALSFRGAFTAGLGSSRGFTCGAEEGDDGAADIEADPDEAAAEAPFITGY